MHLLMLKFWSLTWSSGVSFRNPSQMWGRLYLPMFILRIGLFYPYTYGLLDCSDKALPLHGRYGEVVHSGGMPSDGLVAMHGWMWFEVFIKHLPMCSRWFCYVKKSLGKQACTIYVNGNPKVKILWTRKVELFIGTGARSWNVRMSDRSNI